MTAYRAALSKSMQLVAPATSGNVRTFTRVCKSDRSSVENETDAEEYQFEGDFRLVVMIIRSYRTLAKPKREHSKW